MLGVMALHQTLPLLPLKLRPWARDGEEERQGLLKGTGEGGGDCGSVAPKLFLLCRALRVTLACD